jgi:hypothetical protein
MNNRRIRVFEITDHYIHLAEVSQKFSDAVEQDNRNGSSPFSQDSDRGTGKRI